MISDNFSLGKIYNQVKKLPALRFRDKDPLIHDASSASKCHREVAYKKLGYASSNPADEFGEFKMSMGNWIERGLCYDLFGKGGVFGVQDFGGQGDAGEHGTFYGTSWHGYRDRDILLKEVDQYKFAVVEIKTKIGQGAMYQIYENPYKRQYKVPKPDTEWGHAQQLSLYLRDAYLKTKDNPKFKVPIVDGILLYPLFHDGDAKVAGFIEFYAEYNPKEDLVKFYRAHSETHSECNAAIDVRVKLSDIAGRFAYQDSFISEKKLPPPEHCRKETINEETLSKAKKTELTRASKNEVLLGSVFCKYCSYRDKCAEDLNISLQYTASEIKQIKDHLKLR